MSSYELVIALVPQRDHTEPELPLLTRAGLLAYPYIRRARCERRVEAGRECGCGCLRGYAIAGTRYRGCLWADRYGYLTGDHLVSDPEDEPRLAADVSLRDAGLWPDAVITPDGDVHHLGGAPDARTATWSDLAELEDLILAHPDHIAVPLTCFYG